GAAGSGAARAGTPGRSPRSRHPLLGRTALVPRVVVGVTPGSDRPLLVIGHLARVVVVGVVGRGVLRLDDDLGRGLALLGGLDAEAELAAPADPALVGGVAAGSRGPHPGAGPGADLVEVGPVLPGELLREPVVADHQ